MFKIGEFSRIGRVSMRLLRYYDELGLLRPAHTDSSNGYRYYTAAQIPQLNRILVLRELGLTLEQIARALHDNVSAEELRGMLLMRRAEIEQLQAEQVFQLLHLESRIAALDGTSDSVPDDVVIRAEPEHRYLALRVRHPSFAAAVAMVLEMHRDLPQQVGYGVLRTFVAISHSAEFEPDDLDVELGFTLESEPARLPVIRGRALEVRTLPAHAKVATCVRVGSPVHAHMATEKIARYLDAMGLELAGPTREIFLSPPREGNIDNAVVEMAFPVERC